MEIDVDGLETLLEWGQIFIYSDSDGQRCLFTAFCPTTQFLFVKEVTVYNCPGVPAPSAGQSRSVWPYHIPVVIRRACGN